MTVPEIIRMEVYTEVCRRADQLGWLGLASSSKTRYYDVWSKDPAIGQRLVRYIEAGQIRHYIKDALIKQYTRERRDNADTMLSYAGVKGKPESKQARPLGCRLPDGRTYVWGRANNWKILLLTLYERVYMNKTSQPTGVILTQSASHFATSRQRAVVEDAAKRLGIETVIWIME